ncbi:hypothetical protein [Aphanothece hegewaldii]|uniref:hypothetical protein n=1 Tax=Aphanothece hegewaldii TaxID=1521625 RepID=UPI0011B28F85|nr:hypothetical protein [Aphanothece hegewaldii]
MVILAQIFEEGLSNGQIVKSDVSAVAAPIGASNCSEVRVEIVQSPAVTEQFAGNGVSGNDACRHSDRFISEVRSSLLRQQHFFQFRVRLKGFKPYSVVRNCALNTLSSKRVNEFRVRSLGSKPK